MNIEWFYPIYDDWNPESERIEVLKRVPSWTVVMRVAVVHASFRASASRVYLDFWAMLTCRLFLCLITQE